MRVAAAIAFGLFAVGAALTWATTGRLPGADGDTIGAILMIAGGAGLLALILVSASRTVTRRGNGLESEPIDETHDRLSAGWPRR